MVDVRGDVLRPPHCTIPVGVKSNENIYKKEDGSCYLYMILVHLFVCFAHVSYCHFSLPLGVGGLAVVCVCGTSWTLL